MTGAPGQLQLGFTKVSLSISEHIADFYERPAAAPRVQSHTTITPINSTGCPTAAATRVTADTTTRHTAKQKKGGLSVLDATIQTYASARTHTTHTSARRPKQSQQTHKCSHPDNYSEQGKHMVTKEKRLTKNATSISPGPRPKDAIHEPLHTSTSSSSISLRSSGPSTALRSLGPTVLTAAAC